LVHSERLNEQLVVIGSAVLLAAGSLGVYDTCEMPCVASLHQLYEGRPTLGSAGAPVPSAWILSASDMRATMSAARSSRDADVSQTVVLARAGSLHQRCCVAPSTHRPLAVCVMRPVAAE